MNDVKDLVWRPTMHLRITQTHCSEPQLEQLWERGDEEAWHKGEDVDPPRQEWRAVEIVWYPPDRAA